MAKLEKIDKLKALKKAKKEKIKQKKLKTQSTAKKSTVEKRGRPKKTLTLKLTKKGGDKKDKKLVGVKRAFKKSSKGKESLMKKGKK